MKPGFLSTKMKNDVILGIGLLLVALCLWCIITVVRSRNSDNLVVRITCDGETVCEQDLKIDGEIAVKNNIVHIENGLVYMQDADCPDKLCINQGRIKSAGQTIICLPNRIMVTIVGSRNDYDAYVN